MSYATSFQTPTYEGNSLSHLITIEYVHTELFLQEMTPKSVGSRSVEVDDQTYQSILAGDEVHVDAQGPLDEEGGRLEECWIFNDPLKGWASFYHHTEEYGMLQSYEALKLWHDSKEVPLPDYWADVRDQL